MPIRSNRGSPIQPANSRAVDVAKQALRDIIPVQQRRYDNAFQIVGYESLVYNRLHAGLPCSCMASSRALAALLDEDGKLDQGAINEMLSNGMEYTVNRYGAHKPVREDLRALRDPPLPVKTKTDTFFDGINHDLPAHVPGFNIVSNDLDDPFADTVSPNKQIGTNGNSNGESIDDLIGDFDSNAFGLSDAQCGVCFGSGYVGGYSLVGGWRAVLSSQYPDIDTDGIIEANTQPHHFETSQTTFTLTLPKGFISLDSLKVWSNTKAVNTGRVLIDNIPVTYPLLYTVFDGRPHKVTVQFDELTSWTHLEFQVNLSSTQTKIEFPKLQQASDLTKLDLTEDVQISASSVVPTLQSKDVIVEMTFGKAFIMTTVAWWNDNIRNSLGWDATARVVQPNEILNILPRRRVGINGQRSTQMVVPNKFST